MQLWRKFFFPVPPPPGEGGLAGLFFPVSSRMASQWAPPGSLSNGLPVWGPRNPLEAIVFPSHHVTKACVSALPLCTSADIGALIVMLPIFDSGCLHGMRVFYDAWLYRARFFFVCVLAGLVVFHGCWRPLPPLTLPSSYYYCKNRSTIV